MIGFGQMPMAGSVLVSGLGEDLELIQEPFIALRNVNEMDLEHIRDLYDAGSVTAMENTKFGLERWMVGIDGDFWESLLPEKYREVHNTTQWSKSIGSARGCSRGFQHSRSDSLPKRIETTFVPARSFDKDFDA